MKRLLLMSMMMLTSTVLCAADVPSTSAAATTPVKPADNNAAKAAADTKAPAPTPAVDGKAAAKGDNKPGSSNDPFVPTVQISEDLSVSFPADI